MKLWENQRQNQEEVGRQTPIAETNFTLLSFRTCMFFFYFSSFHLISFLFCLLDFIVWFSLFSLSSCMLIFLLSLHSYSNNTLLFIKFHPVVVAIDPAVGFLQFCSHWSSTFSILLQTSYYTLPSSYPILPIALSCFPYKFCSYPFFTSVLSQFLSILLHLTTQQPFPLLLSSYIPIVISYNICNPSSHLLILVPL